MKKRITGNFAQTWVTKKVKNHGLVRRQPSTYCATPGNEYYIIGQFIRKSISRNTRQRQLILSG